MIDRILRGNVHVIQNKRGAIYEATDNPDIMRINICQTSMWFEGGKPCRQDRIVPYDTQIATFKVGYIMPGNICMALTLEQIGEFPEEYMMWDENGIVCTSEGFPVFTYCYYSPMSKFQPRSLLKEDDVLSELLSPNERKLG